MTHNPRLRKQITRELVDATAEAKHAASGVTIRLNEVYSLGHDDALAELLRVIEHSGEWVNDEYGRVMPEGRLRGIIEGLQHDHT